ncbi:MAG: LacI family DNA-binding transcriptional regulator [Verrucomicrobia bacterium]|nr:LacI family DNA-binding transcriptional regulator [Verrucomicrobiota bacterium]
MSILKVAKMAGVTHGTVSRLINSRGGVSEATAQRIRKAMAKLGYRPKPPEQRRGKTARPAGLHTGNVCLLLVGAPREVLDRPGISTTVATLEAELRRRGLSLFLAQTGSLKDLPPCVSRRKADGLLLTGEACDAEPAAYRSLPAVWLLSSHTQPHKWADHVLPDNERIGAMAAEYLAARGHRLVAFYNDQPKHPGFAVRGAAFCAAARERGMECQSFVAETPGPGLVWGFGPNAACVKLVERLLAAAPKPQAVFVPTDEQVLRLYPLLARHSVVPGRDLGILSCDNQEVWLRQLDPRPPSIDLNFELIGRRAVEQLMSRIAHPEQPPGTRILVPPKPIETAQEMSNIR